MVGILFFQLEDVDVVAQDAISIDGCHFASHDLVEVTDGILDALGDVLVVSI